MGAPGEFTQPGPLPLACALGPEDGRSRLLRWQRLHEIAAPVARLDGGRLEVRYQPGQGVCEELASLAAAEQTCCSFVTWTASVIDGCPVLQVTAPSETPHAVAPIAALFGVTDAPSEWQWWTGDRHIDELVAGPASGASISE